MCSLGNLCRNVLRHPSQIYEGILEGLLVLQYYFILEIENLFDGQLAIMYGILLLKWKNYSRVFRQPDSQLGFIYSDWITMGMLQSIFLSICVILYMKIRNINS